jgi:hypothetical protein
MLRKPDSGGKTVMAAERIVPLERARTFITFLVVLHHSVVNYTYFGNGDRMRCLGFDLVVLFNNSFFMAYMSFISGLLRTPTSTQGAWRQQGSSFRNLIRHHQAEHGVAFAVNPLARGDRLVPRRRFWRQDEFVGLHVKLAAVVKKRPESFVQRVKEPEEGPHLLAQSGPSANIEVR